MREYRICGGRLAGRVSVGGAKNAALPILAAAGLCPGKIEITNCPRIADTLETANILRALGCKINFENGVFTVESAEGALDCEIPKESAAAMRSSILFLGPLLARGGCAIQHMPGGCAIGDRAIDLHISGLEAMGAEIIREKDRLVCSADGLRGAYVKLHFPSVGATENLLVAASAAKGETVLENAAKEPEIIDLVQFLRAMGAEIYGEGTEKILIYGKPEIVRGQFDRVRHEVMPDRIVAGTYLAAAAMTDSEITVENVKPSDMRATTAHLRKMGCELLIGRSSIRIFAPPRLTAASFTTEVYPGMPTDMQAQLAAALCTAMGRSEISETIFSARFSHAAELARMGAAVSVTDGGRRMIIEGRKKLQPAAVKAHDLRCGAALICAALAADGESTVGNIHFVERGYENIVADLRRLGADISLVETPTAGSPA